MMRILTVIGFGTACLLFARGEPNQRVQVNKTEHIDFPSGGTLRLTNSVAVLTVEAWDRPDVEISTIKPSPAPHTRNLRVGCGYIVILKTRVPKPPEPLTPSPKPEGV